MHEEMHAFCSAANFTAASAACLRINLFRQLWHGSRCSKCPEQFDCGCLLACKYLCADMASNDQHTECVCATTSCWLVSEVLNEIYLVIPENKMTKCAAQSSN